MKTGKEYKDVIYALKPIAASIIVTTFSASQDTPISCLDPKTIANYARSIGIDAVILNEPKEAYQHLIASSADINIVTGSFYLIGQIRTFIKT